MTIPKPDLVALAERPSEILERVLSGKTLRLRCGNHLIERNPATDHVEMTPAFACALLDEIASQPSLYEAGQRDMRERAKAVAERDTRSPLAKDYGYEPDWFKHGKAIASAIASLPLEAQESDGGVESRHAGRHWPSPSSQQSAEPMGDCANGTEAGVAPGPSEATPSTAGSVREARLPHLARQFDLMSKGCRAHGLAGWEDHFFRLYEEARKGTISADEIAETIDYDYRNENDGKAAATQIITALLADAALSAPVEAQVAVNSGRVDYRKLAEWVGLSGPKPDDSALALYLEIELDNREEIDAIEAAVLHEAINALRERATPRALPSVDVELLAECRQFVADSGCDEDDSEVNAHRDDLLARMDKAIGGSAR